MAPVLLSRFLDPLLGVSTGLLAYYLYETNPRTEVPENQRLLPLARWKMDKMQKERAQREAEHNDDVDWQKVISAEETNLPVTHVLHKVDLLSRHTALAAIIRPASSRSETHGITIETSVVSATFVIKDAEVSWSKPTSHFNMPSSTFYADAVLFDMDGTLTDSIAAVEAAWGKVAEDIGQDPAYVIAQTHGKRAIDNLAQFKPHLHSHKMDDAVADFEETILYYADAFHLHGEGSQFSTPPASDSTTPDLLPPSSEIPSTTSSFSEQRRPSFTTRLSNALVAAALSSPVRDDKDATRLEPSARVVEDVICAWKIEAASVDRSVRILPGVRAMLDSLPEGRYAVATSGAKTYAHGCMTRVGITPPAVTITADDKRLKAGKPAPDPFLLAADCLGFDAKNCVVFEDSPSGIRAGVASGATVIAVCTSHERSQIHNSGAHYLVENMEQVKCDVVKSGEDVMLKFTVHE
ncbi:hypothetical protein EVG20_g344 [Dentipellis fragilis]|uniref:HAD-like protein n=1 Tax=Dentipellis fragilis TaxID=205917 RepID=A0A4Y9ZFX2_9AGAM|nr:hypothetical protein EVG20_g344 [Dentipellis fragilis]